MMINEPSYTVRRPRLEIEPEEVFQDRPAAGTDTATVERWVETPIHPRRSVGFFIVLTVVGGLLLLQLSRLQIREASAYRSLAMALASSQDGAEPARAVIKDVRGTVLAANAPAIGALFDPSAASPTAADDILERLPDALGNHAENAADRIRSAKDHGRVAVIMEDLTREEALNLSSSWFAERGISLRISAIRSYPLGANFAHLVGYTSSAQPEDLLERPELSPIDRVGQTGVEQAFDALLRGDADGSGKSVRLTVDARLQQLLTDALTSATPAGRRVRAAAVALDPRDGSIRALVSLPGFDPESVGRGLTHAEYQAMANDLSRPFFNRAIAGQYPPGSTIKPFVALAALEEDVIDPSWTVNVTGAITVPNQYHPDILYTFPDWKAHGRVDVRKALAVSSNVFFYIVGGGYQAMEGLGIERMVSWLHQFGFGESAASPLRGETTGLLPTPQWKEKTKGEPWTIGDTYHAAIGQGDVQVTPLQMARATAAIANGGSLVTPHLLDALLDERGHTLERISPPPLTPLNIESSWLDVVRDGMRRAISEGSAARLQSLPVTGAGKTGTAQAGNGREPHAWFTGFFPYEHPALVVTVVIEHAGGSATAAVPVVEQALRAYDGFQNPPQ